MRNWLVVLILDALGLWLLWRGSVDDNRVQFALGGLLVIAVTGLYAFRLLVRFLERGKSGSQAGKYGAIKPFDPVSSLIGPSATDETPLDLTQEVDDAPLLLTKQAARKHRKSD